jgi:hypothetical protein
MSVNTESSVIETDFFKSEIVQSHIANIIEQAQQVSEKRSGSGKASDVLDRAINNLISAKSKEDIIHCYQELKYILRLLD